MLRKNNIFRCRAGWSVSVIDDKTIDKEDFLLFKKFSVNGGMFSKLSSFVGVKLKIHLRYKVPEKKEVIDDSLFVYYILTPREEVIRIADRLLSLEEAGSNPEIKYSFGSVINEGSVSTKRLVGRFLSDFREMLNNRSIIFNQRQWNRFVGLVYECPNRFRSRRTESKAVGLKGRKPSEGRGLS